jgi:hypothetical protein
MSLYFAASKPIPLSDLLDGQLKAYGINVYHLASDPTRYQITDGVNSMFADTDDSNDALSVTHMARYAGHVVDSIIEALQQAFDVAIFCEYDPEYWGGICPWDPEFPGYEDPSGEPIKQDTSVWAILMKLLNRILRARTAIL